MSGKSLRGLNLADANLTDADLTGANVTGTKLGHATLLGVRTGRLHGKPASLPHGYRLVDGYLIGAGASLVDADLGRINLSGVNLTNADLGGVDVGGANLGRAVLADTIVAGADFHDANLSHASLKDARDEAPEAGHAEKSLRGHADATADASVDLTGANLTDANLSGALLTNASMDGASLTGANLTQVDWQGADLSGLDLAGADLAGVDLDNVNLTGTELTGANLAGVSLTDVTATNATWTGANLAGVSFNAATVTGGNFTGANLEGATFDGTVSGGVHGTPTTLTAGYEILDGYFVGPDVSLQSAPFSAADLHGMNLSGADLTKANLAGANLSGTNLTDANLTDGNLTGANLSGTNVTDANLTDGNLTGATITGITTTGAISAGVIPAPNAQNVSFSAAYETTLTVPTWYGLDNYASGLGFTVSLAQPANGNAVLKSGGSFTYLANQGFLGDDSLRYTVTDVFGRTASATVTVHVSMTGYIMQTLSVGPADMPGWENSGSWYGVVYDGTNLWAAATPEYVSEIDPSNGAGLGGFGPTEVLYGAGGQMGLATDGADIWVSGNVSTFQGDFSSVTELSTSNPVSYGSVWTDGSAEQPGALAYGDAAVWVANPDGTVTKLSASSGATIGNYSACGAAEAASDVAYSGGDVWVACSNFVTELDASDGSLIGTYGLSTGAARYLTISDGDVWVAGRGIGSSQNGTLTELSAATGAVIATQNLPEVAPTAILTDGTNIWVASGNTLVGIDASTGSLVLNDIGVNLSDGVASMTFDGSHIWATTGTGGLVEIDDPVS